METNVKMVFDQMLTVFNDDATPPPVKTWLQNLLTMLQEEQKDPRLVKGTSIPTTVGAMADEYSIVREKRLAIERTAREVKDRETELYNVIMSTLDESTDTGASGKLYRVQRIEKEQSTVADWPSLWSHIQSTGAFDLLQKRLNDKAARDQIEAGQVLPGVETRLVPTLSFRKVD